MRIAMLALLWSAVAWAQVAPVAVPVVPVTGNFWSDINWVGLGGFVAAIAAAAVSVITVMRQGATAAKVDTLGQKTAQIETSVNSEKTAATMREKALQDQVQNLQGQIEDHKRTAALLAQAAAISTTAAPVAAVASSDPARYKRIADATAALAEAMK